MKIKTIDELIREVGLPKGFVRKMWKDVEDGERVWLWGQHDGKPVTYGPHTVLHAQERSLENCIKRRFLVYSEDLLVRE